MDETLARTLHSLKVKAPVSHGPLHLFPLHASGCAKEDSFLLLDDGLRIGTLRVEELNKDGSVTELRVTNGGACRF